ncbi:MAG: 1-methylthio-xylulose 5-phosphate sulfo-lyase [Acidobacteriota bacterium]|nr:MAG: cupin domain-containing protein [Acidobacteriota bacterium]
MSRHRRSLGDYRWDGVELRDYKPAGTHFRGITRQVLFDGPGGLGAQLRYFEIAPGGHSTLERHRHPHAVMVLRGRGRALAGDRIVDLAPFDLLEIGPDEWHQFRADDEPLGFLCLVDCERDRPVRPGPADLERLRRDPRIAAFIRV